MLLNLLIAQMSDEFDALKHKAALEHQLGFARRVLRTELLTTRLFGLEFASTVYRVGDLEPGSSPPAWYFTYTEVGRNVEGRTLGGEDIFADLSDSDDEDDEFHFSNTKS